MRIKKNTALRVVAINGNYSVFLCKIDEEGDVSEVLENIFSREFASYSALISLTTLLGVCIDEKRPVVNINSCNKKLYGY